MTQPFNQVSHSDVRELRGPLLVLGDAVGVGWDEYALVEVEGRGGLAEERHALVLEVDHDLVTLQVLEGTGAMHAGGVQVRFAGLPLHIPVGTSWLGRTCNGRGEPLDGGPPVTGETTMPLHGWPLNPVHREPPAEPVITGISVIDALTTVGHRELKKNGLFTLPGFAKFRVVKKPATKAREGVNPFTGEKMVFKAKPASKKVRVMPLKNLKGFVN